MNVQELDKKHEDLLSKADKLRKRIRDKRNLQAYKFYLDCLLDILVGRELERYYHRRTLNINAVKKDKRRKTPSATQIMDMAHQRGVKCNHNRSQAVCNTYLLYKDIEDLGYQSKDFLQEANMFWKSAKELEENPSARLRKKE